MIPGLTAILIVGTLPGPFPTSSWRIGSWTTSTGFRCAGGSSSGRRRPAWSSPRSP